MVGRRRYLHALGVSVASWFAGCTGGDTDTPRAAGTATGTASAGEYAALSGYVFE